VDSAVVAVTREAVELVDKNCIKSPVRAVGYHLLKLRALVAGSGQGAVDVVSGDLDTVLGSEFLADVELTLDRLLGLISRGITPVEYCFFHEISVLSVDRKEFL